MIQQRYIKIGLAFGLLVFVVLSHTAVRLEIVFADAPCGVQEWLIDR